VGLPCCRDVTLGSTSGATYLRVLPANMPTDIPTDITVITSASDKKRDSGSRPE
jgi:hypothetical protein